MNKYKWIAEKGKCSQEDLIATAVEYCAEDAIYIAMHIDRPEIGQAVSDRVSQISVDNLMELRIFNSDWELFATRSRCGEEFKWRVTSDKELETQDYIVRYQAIDLNKVKSMRNGNELQISDQVKRAKVMSYIAYDEFGMAKAVDNRVCGFVE